MNTCKNRPKSVAQVEKLFQFYFARTKVLVGKLVYANTAFFGRNMPKRFLPYRALTLLPALLNVLNIVFDRFALRRTGT